MAKTIFGAGNSAANPVKLQVLCEDKRAMIPFIIKNEDKSDVCDTKVTFEDHSQEVTFTDNCDCRSKTECGKYADYDKKSGSFTYDGLTVYYELELITDPCPEGPPTCSGCSIGNYWVTKSDDRLIVSYEKYTVVDCNKIEKKIESSSITCSDNEISIPTGCKDTPNIKFKYKCSSACTESGSTIINVRGTSFTPLSVEYSGGVVNTLINYEKIVIDENCIEHKTTGSIILSATVEACSEEVCCLDHSAEIKIRKVDLLNALGLENTVTVKYKGQIVGKYLILSIMQKANPGPECNKDCNYVTTYCVLEGEGHEIKVEYETYWGSKIWVSGGTVSPAGGRVRVSFDYLATAIAVDESGKPITDKEGYQINPDGTRKTKDGQPILETACKPYEFNGNDYVIIEVPPCAAEESSSGTGEVIIPGDILYKDRSSWCGTGTTHVKPYQYTDVFGKTIVMNQISYEVKQDCSGICEPGTYKVYKQVTGKTAEACDTVFSGNAEYYDVIIDEDCKTTTGETHTEPMTIQISPNQTSSQITITNDYFIITQEAGPCSSGGGCSCDDALTIFSGIYPDVCDNPEYVYEEVYITCDEHNMVEVPFKGYCDGVAVYNGTYSWVSYFPCNGGADPITYRKEVNGGVITVIQSGGCTDCGEPPTPTECTFSVSGVYNGVNNKFTSDGDSNLVKVATIYNFNDKCSCEDIVGSSIVPDTSSCTQGSEECSSYPILYDITVVTEGDECVVKAKVNANHGGSGHNVQQDVSGKYEKWHYKVEDCEGCYFNFYQIVDEQPIPPSVCSGETHGLGGTCIQANPGSNKVKVGTYTKTDACTSNWTANNNDWVTNVEFRQNGDIYANVAENGNHEDRSIRILTHLNGYGDDYFDICQSGGEEPPTACICNISSVYVYPTYYDYTGSTEPVKLGTITYVEGCSGPTTFRDIEIKQGSSTIWSGASDFEIRPTSNTTADVYAIVPLNTEPNVRAVHVVFNCMQQGSPDKYDYFNFYQQAGSPTPPSVCSGETHGLGGICVPADPGSNKVKVGWYEKTDVCTSDWEVTSIDQSWVTNVEFRQNGDIYANVAENTGERREATVNTNLPSYGTDFFKVCQSSAGENEFDSLVAAFRTVTNIPDNGPTYNYLHELYNEAKAQQQGTSQHGLVSLYKEDNFPLPDIHKNNIYGSTEDTSKAFSAMTGWLFAMQLSELVPKKRTSLMTLGYNLGGNMNSNMFGYKFNSDPNVARLVGSAIYVTMRTTQNPNLTAMRTELGTSKYSDNLETLRCTLADHTCTDLPDNYFKWGENDFYLNVREFLPGAPGPYLSNYTTRPSRGTVGDAKVTNIPDYNGNTVVDYNIHTGITSTYNLTSTIPEIKTRTVQAIADKEGCVNHLFGPQRPTSNYGYIYPVFGRHNYCSDTDMPTDKTNLNDMINVLGDIAQKQRKVLQDINIYTRMGETPEYGRRRPAETTTDGVSKEGVDGILCNAEIQNADGCPDAYYDRNGNYVPIDSSLYVGEGLCDYEHRNIWANSYPSGHSAYIWINALLLMELYPERANRFMAAANTFAISRTIARYHYTSDTIIGRIIGTVMSAMCHAASDYDSRLAAIKGELNIQ